MCWECSGTSVDRLSESTNLVSECRNIIFNPSHIPFHTFINECVKKLNLLLKYAGFLLRGMGRGCRDLHAPDLSGQGPHDSSLGPAQSKNENFVPGPQGPT